MKMATVRGPTYRQQRNGDNGSRQRYGMVCSSRPGSAPPASRRKTCWCRRLHSDHELANIVWVSTWNGVLHFLHSKCRLRNAINVFSVYLHLEHTSLAAISPTYRPWFLIRAHLSLHYVGEQARLTLECWPLKCKCGLWRNMSLQIPP